MSNLSSLTTTPILIEPEISHRLLRAVAAVHILAIMPVLQSGLTQSHKLLIGVILLGSYCWQQYRLRHRRFGIRYHQQRWTLYRPGSEPDAGIEVSLAGEVIITRWFIVLCFYLPQSRWRQQSILIAADALPSTTFRHLRVLLKWGL